MHNGTISDAPQLCGYVLLGRIPVQRKLPSPTAIYHKTYMTTFEPLSCGQGHVRMIDMVPPWDQFLLQVKILNFANSFAFKNGEIGDRESPTYRVS